MGHLRSAGPSINALKEAVDQMQWVLKESLIEMSEAQDGRMVTVRMKQPYSPELHLVYPHSPAELCQAVPLLPHYRAPDPICAERIVELDHSRTE